MPKFGKLNSAEVEQYRKRKTPVLDLTEYTDYLATLKAGDWGAVILSDGENIRAVKRRLTMAAKSKGLTLRYKRSEDDRIVFELK